MSVPAERGRSSVNYLRRFREVAPGVGLPVDFSYSTPAAPGVPALTLHVLFRDGEWVPVKLELDAPPDESLTTLGVRVPLGRAMQDAMLAAARPLTFDPHDEAGRHQGDYDHEPTAVKVVQRLNPDGTRQACDTDAWLLMDASPGGELADTWRMMTADQLSAAVLKLEARPTRFKDLEPDDDSVVRDTAARRRRAPIPMADDDLRAVAERYRDLVATGVRNPTAQIAAERHVSRMTASRWLRRARDLKLLGKAEPGRAQKRDPQ